MWRMNMAKLIGLCSSVLVTACSTVDHRPDADTIEAFEPGITTAADALALLGPSSMERIFPDRQRLLQWGKPLQADAIGNQQRIAILFDHSGRMLGAMWGSSER